MFTRIIWKFWQNRVPADVNSMAAIQPKNVERGHVASIITKNVRNVVPLHEHKPTTSIRLSPRWQLSAVYARWDRTETLQQLFFQMSQRSFTGDLFLGTPRRRLQATWQLKTVLFRSSFPDAVWQRTVLYLHARRSMLLCHHILAATNRFC